jgi:hypothetical protein
MAIRRNLMIAEYRPKHVVVFLLYIQCKIKNCKMVIYCESNILKALEKSVNFAPVHE